MRTTINGKAYDTETAKSLALWSNNFPRGDFGYCSEELYLKKSGEFFLYGEGGAASKYSKSCGNNEWRGGEKIVPLTYEAAQKWTSDNCPEDYERIFGTVSEGEEHLNVVVSGETKAKLNTMRSKTGKSYRQIIEELVETLPE